MSWARYRKIPVVSSVHTRFDTYLQYYNLKWLEPVARAIMRRYYRRCDAIIVPAESTAAIMRAQRMNKNISIWARGVDRSLFNPERRSIEWRRERGIGDEEMVVSFLGRLVLEKGLDVFLRRHRLCALEGRAPEGRGDRRWPGPRLFSRPPA